MLRLIKCYDSAEEDDWNRFLFAPLGARELFSPDFSVVEDNAIFFVIGTRGLNHVPPRFVAQIKTAKRKGLYHLGDEYVAGGYELYRHFDFVIRNHHAAFLDGHGIKTIPLGYPNGMMGEGDGRAASERPLIWCFLGNWSAPRADMAAHFRELVPHHLYFVDAGQGRGQVTREEYKTILRSSAFAPCPMGNVMLETWRLYEALEAGAIPLLSRRFLMPYHDRVMPGHPIPAFRSWARAERYVAGLRADPPAMDALQRRIGDWWAACKESLQHELCDFVTQGFNGAFRAELTEWRPHTGARLQAWRMMELLKHHDLVAVKGRCDTMVKRLGRSAGVGEFGRRAKPSDANSA